MAERFVRLAIGVVALLTLSSSAAAQTWNSPGMGRSSSRVASRRPGAAPDLTGIWDGGPAGVGATGRKRERARRDTVHGAGRRNGTGEPARKRTTQCAVPEINDPLSTMGIRRGFRGWSR